MASRPVRIICVGNRLKPGDDLGPRVHDLLRGRGVPAGVELIDGGLAGLNLLGLMEGADRVVFVDALSGFGEPGRPVVLDGLGEAAQMEPEYGHSGGLAYLLRALPGVWPGDLPRVWVVGAEGNVDEPALAELADACLAVALTGGGETGGTTLFQEAEV